MSLSLYVLFAIGEQTTLCPRYPDPPKRGRNRCRQYLTGVGTLLGRTLLGTPRPASLRPGDYKKQTMRDLLV
eukprot:5736181-Amphidinium_carterae.1